MSNSFFAPIVLEIIIKALSLFLDHSHGQFPKVSLLFAMEIVAKYR